MNLQIFREKDYARNVQHMNKNILCISCFLKI